MAGILVVGPLPPPVHGFSAATEMMVQACRARTPVHVLNTADGVASLAVSLLRAAAFLARRRPGAMYLALSGGYRQLVDLFATLVFRLGAAILRIELRVCVHHHSFKYLDKRSGRTALLFRALGRQAVHVALCETMATRLAEAYAVPVECLKVLSNATLVQDQVSAQQPAAFPDRDRLVLGYLSNLTEEKGVFSFLELCTRLRRGGYPVDALLAGPLPSEIAERFHTALAEAGGRHIGPVYGAGKAEFFASVDAFVFPTRYKNEAEPLVLWEAFSAGLPVLSFARGCICAIVPGGCGQVVERTASDPLAEFERTVHGWLQEPGRLRAMSARSRVHFEASRQAAQATLDELVQWMAYGT